MNAAVQKCVWGMLVVLASVWSLAARADYSVTCESRGNREQSCRLREPGWVRMEQKLSGADCRQGRDWNYDRDEIRVWDGCRAVFTVVSSGYRNGREYRDHDRRDDNRDAKIAAGVVASALILGAIANAHKDDEHSRRGNEAPDWAVGRFEGYNAKYDAEVSLTIRSNGDMDGRAQGQSFSGYVDGDVLRAGGSTFTIERTSDGFVTSQVGDRENQVFYRRR